MFENFTEHGYYHPKQYFTMKLYHIISIIHNIYNILCVLVWCLLYVSRFYINECLELMDHYNFLYYSVLHLKFIT